MCLSGDKEEGRKYSPIIHRNDWCPGRDSNSHEHSSQRPEHCVSTNFTTWAGVRLLTFQIVTTYMWCRRRDSNSHEHSSQRPEHCVSTNFTTSAWVCKSETYQFLTNGAQGETRTLTSIAHSDLNTACLPISPPGLEARHVTTSHITLTVLFLLGTRGRTRTGTPAKAGDFESPASTNFATLAHQ